MHDNETMALMPRDIMSSHHFHQPLHMLPFEYHAKKSYEHLYKVQVQETDSIHIQDDEDFSDHDSHYSEDEIDVIPLRYSNFNQTPSVQDMTKRLLDFADMANNDIQKFFGRRKGEEDSCDIYEEKWTSGKSGRELYYADLLKIAQGGDGEKPRKSSKNSSVLTDNRDKFSGIMNKGKGLGPLNELFEYGLKNFLAESHVKNGRSHSKRMKVDHNKNGNNLPMYQRKLPQSFWREPGLIDPERSPVASVIHSSIHHNKSPDFSDLLHHWTGASVESGLFPTDMSTNDISLTSSGRSSHN